VSSPGQRARPDANHSFPRDPARKGALEATPHLPAIVGIVLLFLATRLALLRTRPPFYDEIFTRWIVARPVGGLLAALRLDSGPPLYYELVRLVSFPGAAILAGRAISLVASGVTLAVLLRSGRTAARRVETRESGGAPDAAPAAVNGPGRGLIAAALFSAFPAAVFASSDARSYALAAMFIALSLAALERWGGQRDGERGRGDRQGIGALVFAVICLVLAAYSHDYGVLFFPAPFVAGLLTRRARSVVEGLGASAACGLLFIPGFLLAAGQPAAAIAWMPGTSPAAPLAGLAFAGRYPASLLAAPPAPVILLAAVLLAFAVVRTGSSERAVRLATMTLLPIVLVMLYGALRHPVYFPLRFDSIIAVPLVLWLDATLLAWSRPVRWILLTGMLAIGIGVIAAGAIDFTRRPSDPYRAAATWARRAVDPHATVVSSGYAWLEVWNATGKRWQPRLIAFPREQGEHPGWRAMATRPVLAAERDRLLTTRGDLVWIGERGPEMESLFEAARLEILHTEGPVAVARVGRAAGDH
jgi:hypothetical protein